MWCGGLVGYEISYVSWRLGGVHGVNAVMYTVHINLLYNCFLRIHVQPEDCYCWKAETCSCTLGINVNTPVPSNKLVVLDKKISSTLISLLSTTGMMIIKQTR